MAVMNLDDASITRADDGPYVFEVTCRAHDGDDTIETETIHSLAADHDLHVANAIADFDVGEVRLEVASGP